MTSKSFTRNAIRITCSDIVAMEYQSLKDSALNSWFQNENANILNKDMEGDRLLVSVTTGTTSGSDLHFPTTASILEFHRPLEQVV